MTTKYPYLAYSKTETDRLINRLLRGAKIFWVSNGRSEVGWFIERMGSDYLKVVNQEGMLECITRAQVWGEDINANRKRAKIKRKRAQENNQISFGSCY